MEREFRFRAWDKQDNRMFHAHDWPDQFLMMLDCTVFDLTAPDEMGLGLGSAVHDRFILMQFTGLKDKNGKEIYEDDVVKDPGGNCLRVIWNQDACEYQLDHEDGMHSLTIECTEWAEVIGNVFQNPELINKATS